MPPNAAARYNLAVDTPTQQRSELHAVGRGGVGDQAVGRVWHPESPLFWLGALAIVTVGLAAVSGSGSVRVGPLHASASAGAGK
jgi:hypothetical protein